MKNARRLSFAILLAALPFAGWAADAQKALDAGTAAYQQKDYAKAVGSLREAVKADPQNWRAYQWLGNSLYALGQKQDALGAFDRSLELHPDNAPLRSYADSLRQSLGLSAPGLPDLSAGPAPAMGGGDSARALQDAQQKVRAAGLDPATHPYLTDFYEGKLLEERGRDGLKLSNGSLSPDESSVARYGDAKGEFRDNHFSLVFGIFTPTLADLDLGVYLEPTLNVGLSLGYIPLSYDEYVYSNGYSSSVYTLNRELIYLEPRVKWYSAPSGLTTYNGFSFVYFGYHEGRDYDGYVNPSFDIFALGYLFGFRTMPMDGMTMELGFKVGAAVLFNTTSYSIATLIGTSPYYTYSYTYEAHTDTIPFPFIIPEFRFGFTF